MLYFELWTILRNWKNILEKGVTRAFFLSLALSCVIEHYTGVVGRIYPELTEICEKLGT